MPRASAIWNETTIARLLELGDGKIAAKKAGLRRGITWVAIGAEFGLTEAGALKAYQRYCELRAIAARPIEVPPSIVPAMPLARVARAEPRPRYFSDVDAEILSRIARQGTTAGLLGDPPAGRSALDRKRAGLP